jgi:hypothetical protein
MHIEKCIFKGREFRYNPDTYRRDFQISMFNEEYEDRQNWWNIKEGDIVVDVGAGMKSV